MTVWKYKYTNHTKKITNNKPRDKGHGQGPTFGYTKNLKMGHSLNENPILQQQLEIKD